MASLNKVMLIGNAGRDAELRYLANGTAQAQFSLAVNRNYRGPDGDWKEETEWFNVVAWRDLAERLSQNVTKGKQVYVEGRLQSRSWDDDQGQKHTRVEVVANSVLLLGARDSAGGAGQAWGDGESSLAGRGSGRGGTAAPTPRGQGGGGGDVDVDDLPFE